MFVYLFYPFTNTGKLYISALDLKNLSKRFIMPGRASKKLASFLHRLEHTLRFSRLFSETFKQIFENLKFLPLVAWRSDNLL